MNENLKFLKEVFESESLPEESLPEFVFWGRSNVGKSSLINSITKSKIAKTSKTPGRTRSLVFFEFEKKIRIIDFPGYGYSKIPKFNEFKIDRLIENYLTQRQVLKFIFLLIDARHGIMEIDKKILDQLDKILGSKVIIIFTKIDKLKNQDDKQNLLRNNEQINQIFDKTFFNTSIKNSNDIFLLRKFLFKSIEE
ncbi:MAG: ribosome biogenesis GTP-binding protein YihA/YsxC [Alphaproteobacteria bacterium]|tara:strand:+ start:2025 stop:2609 length:585 start_codon:yes stop_codon:yes gene_type:complete